MTNTTDEPLHVDDWLDTPNFHHCIGEDYAKFVLDYHRWPAWKQQAYHQWMRHYKLFCTYEGQRYRCIGASRMGDVWLTSNFDREYGYDLRVDVEKCSDWSNMPHETDYVKQPSPLTAVQIDEIAESMPGGVDGFLKGWGWNQFARAIEAAHGIKEK